MKNKLTQICNDVDHTLANLPTLNFCNLLFSMREALCISRRMAAKECGMPYFHLYSYESGNFAKMPTPKVISRLADYYGIPANELQLKAKAHLIEQATDKLTEDQ